MSTLISCLSIAKKYNGYFMSPEQAKYLTAKLNSTDGAISSEGYITYIKFDDKGITKIYNIGSKTKKTVVKFERQGAELEAYKISVKIDLHKGFELKLKELVKLRNDLMAVYWAEDNVVTEFELKMQKDIKNVKDYLNSLFFND